MPKLPDAQSLGQRPTPRGARGVTDIRLGRTEQAASEFGQQLNEIGQEIERRNDVEQVSKAQTALQDAERQRLLQGDDAILNRRGENAKGAASEFEGWFDQTAEELSGGLSSNAQRDTFREWMSRRRESALQAVSRHEIKERDTAFQGALEGRITTSVENAAAFYDNADALRDSRQDMLDAVDTMASASGWAPEEKDAKRANALSTLHVGVVEAAVDADLPYAKSYYEDNKEEVLGTERARVERLFRERNREELRKYTSGLGEQRRQWEAGANLDTDRYSEEEIRSRVPDEELQDELIADARHSKRIGEQSNWIRGAAPKDIDARARELQARMASDIGREGEFDEASREYDAFQRAVDRHQKALEDDRAAYVISTSPTVKRAWERFEESPDSATIDSYIDVVESEQIRLGVPSHKVRLLPNTAVADVAARLELVDRTPEGARNLQETMRDLQIQYGEHWPTVQRQLEEQEVISGTHAVAAGLDAPIEQKTALQLLTASAAGRDSLKQQVDRPGLTQELSEAIVDELSDFQVTLRSETGGDRVYDNYRESVEILALHHMSRGGSNVSRAVGKATEELITNRYTMAGTFRVPKNIEHKAAAIENGAVRQRRQLDEYDLVPPRSAAGLDDEATKEAWVSILKSEGYWVTNADETGLQLVDPDGYAVTVQDGDDEAPLELTWEELARGESSTPRTDLEQESRLRPSMEGIIQ